MNLIPKAKPVRIRITSGNEEHYSLESLRRNFVWSDVKKLFEGGRLVKWLRRIDADGIADNLLQLDKPEEMLLEVYNILFRSNNPFISEKALIQEYLNGSNELESPAKQLVKKLKISDLIDIIRKNIDHLQFFYTTILSLSEDTEVKISSEELYQFGNLLLKAKEYSALGIIFMNRASEAGSKEAKEILENLSPNRLTTERENRLLNDPMVKERILKSWEDRTFIDFPNNPVPSVGDKSDVEDFFNFSDNCLRLYLEAQSSLSAGSIPNNAQKFFGLTKPDSLFYPAKLFVLAITQPDIKKAKQYLGEIRDYFPLAKALLSRHPDASTSSIVLGSYHVNHNARYLKQFFITLINSEDMLRFNVKQHIINSWESSVPLPASLIRSKNDFEKNELFKLTNICKKISQLNNSGRSLNQIEEDILSSLDNISNASPYFKDVLFLKALFSLKEKDARFYLGQLRDLNYGAANFLIETFGKRNSLKKVYVKSMGRSYYFELVSYSSNENRRSSIENNGNNLLHLILNLDQLRNYAQSGK